MDELDKRSYIHWMLSLANFWAHNITPYNLIRCFLCPEQKKWYEKNDTPFIDWYVFLWLVIFIFFWVLIDPTSVFWRGIFLLFAAFRLLDMTFCFIQTTGIPTSSLISGFRGLILSIINYLQIIFIFAIIYRIDNMDINCCEAFYFSVFTMTNIGKRSSASEWIIAMQSLMGLFFMAIVIASFVNYLGQRRSSNN